MNAIVYFCDDERCIFPTGLSFSSSLNISIDIVEKVKEHSKSIPNGFRHNITFYDFSTNQQMTIPHMYPLDPGLSVVPISLEDESLIKKELIERFYNQVL